MNASRPIALRFVALVSCAWALGLAGCGAGSELDDVPTRPDRVVQDAIAPSDLPEVDVATSDAVADGGFDTIDDSRTDVRAMDSTLDAPRDSGAVDIATIDAADCRARLRALGATFTVAGATMGIADPINLASPINGVHFRYSSFTAADRNMLMDCRLGLAVEALSRQLRDRWQITDVIHLGTYNYRCIAGTDPCRLSQHAYGLAIDLNAFRNSAGQSMSVTTDFVANGMPTCPPRASNMVDRTLKDIACWMYDSRTFNIILTPNYNAAHRDHYHVDLTAGSHFIGLGGIEGVDPMVGPGLPDLFVDDD